VSGDTGITGDTGIQGDTGTSGEKGDTGTEGISEIAGSAIMSDTSGSVVKHNVSTIVAGSYNQIETDVYGHITAGSIVTSGGVSFQVDQSGGTSDTYGILTGAVDGSNKEYTVSLGSYVVGSLSVYLNGQLQTQGSSEDWVETTPTSGTFTFDVAPLTGDEITAVYQFITSTTGNADTVDGYHASALLGRTAVSFIPLNQSTALTGTETNYIRIPLDMNGYNLIEVAASCSGSSTSGSPTFTVKSGSTSMLSVNIMIDEGEYDSSTSGCAVSINTDEDDVATGDKIWVSSGGSDTCGTGVTWTGIELTFQLP